MKNSKLIALMLAASLMLTTLTACGNTATQNGGDTSSTSDSTEIGDNTTEDDKQTTADSSKDTTTEKPDPEPAPPPVRPSEAPELFTAAPKTAEVYDANAEHNEFRILGVGVSDGDHAAVFGECATGALITCTTDDGEFTVQSEKGSFALRVKTKNGQLDGEFTQTYNGQLIGEAITYSGKAATSENTNVEEWAVLMGKNNQGFFQKMLPDFMHTNLLDDATVEKVKNKYASRVNQLKSVGDGCEMITVLVPASMTVYPELVPEEYKQGEGMSKLDQVAELLRDAGVTVIDVREAFAEHKNDELPLYYKYDSHWADYGGYIAYVELFDYISEKFPYAAPRQFNEFTWEWGRYTGGDMPSNFGIDKGGLVYEPTYIRSFADPKSVPGSIRLIKRYSNSDSVYYGSFNSTIKSSFTYNTHREELPNLYLYRSSYGACFYDIVAERGNSSVFQPMFTYTFNINQIKKAAPDYIIYVVSEWDIDNILNN